MKRMEKIITGLQILAKYEDSMCAEHDRIYAGPDDGNDVSPEDKERLESLDWEIGDSDRWEKNV